MYNLPHFKEKDPQVVLNFIHQHPFALVTGCNAEHQPVATQVPVFIEERNGRQYLTGHMMRNTDHHKAFEKNAAVLCVFTAGHAYVSATWYNDPQQASTWNYMSVHVRGRLRFLAEEGLIEVLKKTSLHFEGGNRESPTVFNNLTESYTRSLMKAIIAFEIEAESIDHVFKLSQNRDQQSYQTIIEKLEEQGGDGQAIAKEMKQRQNMLFAKNKTSI